MPIPSNFRLLTINFPKAFFFLLLTFCLLTVACQFNPNMQGKGQVYLQGEWQQDSAALHKQLVSYSVYHFKFDCDSFYIKIKSHSKVNYGTDSCMSKGQWMEYTRGVYEQRHDTLYLKGQFCNADFSLKKAGDCFRAGNYQETFKVLKKTDSLALFTSTSDVIPINVRLTKTTVCHQKPL